MTKLTEPDKNTHLKADIVNRLKSTIDKPPGFCCMLMFFCLCVWITFFTLSTALIRSIHFNICLWLYWFHLIQPKPTQFSPHLHTAGSMRLHQTTISRELLKEDAPLIRTTCIQIYILAKISSLLRACQWQQQPWDAPWLPISLHLSSNVLLTVTWLTGLPRD